MDKNYSLVCAIEEVKMTWTSTLWTICASVINITIDYAATFLDGIGSLASTVGGAGMAVGSIVEEQINPSYFISIETPGQLTVGIDIPSLGLDINQTIPFNYLITEEGQLLYNSQNYLAPQSVMLVSTLLVVSGTVLKVLSANLDKWREYKEDKHFLKKHKNIDYLAPPVRREYRYCSTAALYRSLSYSALSYVVVSGVFSFSSLRNAIQSITYPSSGDEYVVGENYNGPVANRQFPVVINYQQNGSVLGLLVEENAQVQAIANVTYGGGVFFKAKDKPDLPIVVPIIVAVSTDQLSRFFKSKALHERDKRIREAQDNQYSLIY